MQNFDYGLFYKTLQHEIFISTDFAASLQKMLAWCEKQNPHESWKKLQALNFSAEVSRVEPWLSQTLKRSPCQFPVKAVYFGLGEFEKCRAEYADLYFGLMGQCDLSDKKSKWFWGDLRHYPDNAYLESIALEKGGIICSGGGKQKPGLGTPGLIAFSLSFSALLLKASLNSKIHDLFGSNEPVVISLGFDSGDIINLGHLQTDGFIVNTGEMFC